MTNNKTYIIEEKQTDPKYGRIRFVHLPLLDDPIEGYIKSNWFIVTDRDGKEITSIEEINKMKHWIKSKNIDRQECVYLKDNNNERILLVAVSVDNDKVTFTEACDEWFSTTLSKQEAIEALEELIKYINKDEE